jgi:hypothetical protein
MFDEPAAGLALATPAVRPAQRDRVARILAAGRRTGQCVLYFTVSFTLTAAVFILAHI